MSTTLRSLLSQLVCCRGAVFSTLMTVLVFQMFSPNAVNAAFSEVYNSETMVGPPSQPGITKICTFSAYGNASSNHALVINNLPGITNPRYDFSAGQQGTIAFFSDGTARLTGRLVNKGDANQQWDMDFYFSDQMDWSTWSGQVPPRDWKNEGQGATNQYLDWDYFIFDPSKTSSLIGAGSLTGSSLVITHMPADYHYGFQVGDYANCKNGNYGAAAWFFASGTVNEVQVSGKHGDINLNLGCRNVTKECLIDEYASGSHVLWLNNLPTGVGNNWVNIPGQKLSFLELTGGEAAIYGKVQNQNNSSLKLTVSYWFDQKSNWATWSSNVPARSWKGNAGIVGSNYLNWDYYIFNTSVASTLIGCSDATLNTYIIATHMPASYLYGLQVGTAANDKNGNEGLSTWFFLNGKFKGNNVNGNQGDINGNTNCAPPFLICVDTPPIITCPADVTIDCAASIDPANTGVATSDRPNSICPGDVIISYSDVVSGSVCPKVITRTWNVVDEYGNSVSCDQTITLTDNLAPIISGVPAGITIQCIGDLPPAATGVTAADNCDSDVALTVVDGACQFGSQDGCAGLRTQTPGGWGSPANGNNPGAYRDANFAAAFPGGLTIGCTNTLTLTSAAAVQAFLPSGGPSMVLPAGSAVNPGGSISNTFAGHLVALTLSVGFDNYDPNFATSSFALANALVNSGPLSGLTVQQLLNEANSLIGGCGSSYSISDVQTALTSVNENFVDGTTQGTDVLCPGLLGLCEIAICRTWTATDDCGNSSSSVQVIIVSDTTNPVFDQYDSELVFECSDDIDFNNLPGLTATDNCGVVDVSYVDGEITSEECLTTFERTYTAIDPCGNIAIAVQTISIVDTTAPVLEAPAISSVNLECSDVNLQAILDFVETGASPGQFVNQVAGPLFLANGLVPTVATDNCDPTPTISETGIEALPGECPGTAILTCFFQAVDDCGNVSNVVATTINIVDTTPPVITCPADATVECDGDTSPAATGSATATDNCGTATVAHIDGPITGTCPSSFVRTWTATDACGNASSCTQTIMIIDTTAPVLEAPTVTSVDLECNSVNLQAILAFVATGANPGQFINQVAGPLFLANGLVPTTATDNCDENPTILETGIQALPGECPGTAILTCFFQAQDDCGNLSNVVATTINIVDTTAPVIVCPADITVDCSSSLMPSVTGMATASDDCGAATVTYTDGAITGECTQTLVRTWTATDECGLTSTCTQTITITDTTAPVLVMPTATSGTATCDQLSVEDAIAFGQGINQNGFLQAARNLFMQLGLVPTNTIDDCNESEWIETGVSVVVGECPVKVTLTCFFVAVDACGNTSATASTSINIVDETAPVIVCPADITVDCSSSLMPSVTGSATATDDCGSATVTYTDGAITGECTQTLVRTWTATDECGLTSTCTQTITITDTTAPVLVMPTATSGTATCDQLSVEDAIAFGQGINQNGFLQAARNLFMQLGLVPTNTIDDCNESEWIETGVSVVVGECPVKVTLTCFFVAVDACGNTSATASTSINIVDETAPVIVCPADITVDCSSSLMPSVTGSATATDDCGAATVTYTDGAITGECTQTLVRTWTATDECGLTSTCTQTITIVDTTAPVLIMPEQTFIHITCTAVNYGTLLNLAAGNLTNGQANAYRNFLRNIFMTNGLVPTGAEDDCNEVAISETSIQIITEGLDCPAKAIVRCVFIATDACGNVSDEQYTELIVIDQTTPHIFCPSDIVVVCGSDTSPSVTGFATATDNCSGPMNISYYDTSVTSFCPTSFVRVWVAEDGCGNVATCEQLITLVEDDNCTTAPTGLVATVTAPNTVLLTWNPVPGSIGCRVFARALGSNNTLTIGTVVGNAPSQLLVQSNLLQNGLTIQWRVICACSTNPLVTTPYSPWNTFTYNWNSNKSIANPDNNGNSGISLESGRVYPNPTLSSTFLNAKMSEGDVIMVRDISGMTVTSLVAPAESDVLEIDMKRLAAGVYFIQHIDRSGIPHVYKVIKN